MFQSFEIKTSPENGRERIAALRQEMKKSNVDAFLVPHADEHQNEYLPPCAERLAWLTGFTGSAGFCIVTARNAILFVDGRYTLQAANQCDPDTFTIADLVSTPPSSWLTRNAARGWRIGFDPWLTTIAQKRTFDTSVEGVGAKLVASPNLVDRVWPDRPPAPDGEVTLRPQSMAGVSAQEKLATLASTIAADGADLVLLSDPASIAWAFNIRGNDIAHIPVALAWAIVPASGKPILFIDPAKLDSGTRGKLTRITSIVKSSALAESLAELAVGKKVMLDANLVASALGDLVSAAGATILEKRDPVVIPRAVKNAAEIEGMRAAHLRDAIAVTRFLSWMSRKEISGLDEIRAARKLERFRDDTARDFGTRLCEIAFDTISGFAANGAIVHYRVTRQTNQSFEPDNLYLVDSGAQYEDGTTDITRTIVLRNPPPGARRDYTMVLKGHIAIATARFPAGTRGIDLDPLARIALWRDGKDFGHGTGHGVGAYLSVHEGPQSISRRGMEQFLPGMIVSNEPGFYREDHYGIRIENLELVRQCEEHDGFFEFECLTLVPMERDLVDVALLTRDEIGWWNRYHERVLEEVAPHLDDRDRDWLTEACKPFRT
ncbi:MAG: aminopeptidase P family protein [Rhizobiaceae bacterium]